MAKVMFTAILAILGILVFVFFPVAEKTSVSDIPQNALPSVSSMAAPSRQISQALQQNDSTFAVSQVNRPTEKISNQISLLGTVLGDQNRALIRNNSTNHEKFFKVNDTVFGEGMLSGISNKSVKLLINGELMELSIITSSGNLKSEPYIAPIISAPSNSVASTDFSNGLAQQSNNETSQTAMPIQPKSAEDVVQEAVSLALSFLHKKQRP